MKLQYLILFSFVFQIFCGCIEQKTEITIKGTGTLANLAQQEIFILDSFGDTLKTEIAQSGNTFRLEFGDLSKGYYVLTCRDNQYALYLQPDYALHIDLNGDKAAYSGRGADPNTYLQRKYSSEFNWYANYYKTQQKGNLMSFFRDSYIKNLQEELKKIKENPEFVQDESKELEYEYAGQLLTNKVMLETNPSTDKAILEDLDKALHTNIDDSQDLNNSANYVSLTARILLAQNRIDNEHLSKYYNAITHPIFKTHFLESLVSALRKELQFAEDDFDKAKMVESFITEQQPHDSIGYSIFNLFHKFREAEGKVANFSYENAKGNTVSLESLRGKYVYIDFWATWCTNCIKEFPHLKKLEEQFDGEGIEFVGISIDKLERKEQWKKMVIEKELDNIQLLAPYQGFPDVDDIDDEFINLVYVNAYNLGIPQYTLIDPDGKIIDAFFYRPSNPKTKDYFSKLIEKSGVEM